MNPAFPPMITCPPPAVRFGGIYIADRGKTHQESRVLAAQALHAAGDRSGAFAIVPLDGKYNAVLTGRDLEAELNKVKAKNKLEVIA